MVAHAGIRYEMHTYIIYAPRSIFACVAQSRPTCQLLDGTSGRRIVHQLTLFVMSNNATGTYTAISRVREPFTLGVFAPNHLLRTNYRNYVERKGEKRTRTGG